MTGLILPPGITKLTSAGETVAITDPEGPTADLAVTAAGWQFGIVNAGNWGNVSTTDNFDHDGQDTGLLFTTNNDGGIYLDSGRDIFIATRDGQISLSSSSGVGITAAQEIDINSTSGKIQIGNTTDQEIQIGRNSTVTVSINTLDFTVGGSGGNTFEVDPQGAGGVGFFGSLSAQIFPTPVTLADVIAALQQFGLFA